MKNLLAFVFLLAIFVPVFAFAPHVGAQDFGMDYVDNGDLGLTSNGDPRTIAVRVIKLLMTFLGIVAVVIMLMGGFKWMTAQGDEGKIEEAKNLIVAGIIGIVIILSSFALVNWVLDTASNEILNG